MSKQQVPGDRLSKAELAELMEHSDPDADEAAPEGVRESEETINVRQGPDGRTVKRPRYYLYRGQRVEWAPMLAGQDATAKLAARAVMKAHLRQSAVVMTHDYNRMRRLTYLLRLLETGRWAPSPGILSVKDVYDGMSRLAGASEISAEDMEKWVDELEPGAEP